MLPSGRPGLLVCLAALLAGPARAEDPALLPPTLGASELYATRSGTGLALAGFDPVTYRLPSGPALGSATFEVVHDGLLWHFVDAADRAAFLVDPDSFKPRLGGFDAAAMAAGLVTDSDPAVFAIRDARLYLFRTAAARARFLADPDAAAAAEERWPGLRARLAGG